MAQQFSQQTEEILKGRFIKRVFTETAKDIDKAQSKYISGHGFSNPIFQDREFVSDNNSLQYTHAKALRFVDMKTRQSKQEKKEQEKLVNAIKKDKNKIAKTCAKKQNLI